MKNPLLALMLTLLFPSIGSSQNYLWAEKIGGPNFDVVSDIDVDSANNSVVVGQFFNSITFNSTTLTSNGSSDGFVAKIDQDGNPLWIIRIGGFSTDQVNGVKVDRSTGDIYVTGTYNAAFTVAGTALPYTAFGPDAFLIKISSAGTIVWGKGFSGSGSDNSIDVTVDETNGFVYAMGIGSDSLSIDTASLTVASGQFIYVAKYTTSGTFQWARQYDTQASIASGFGSKRGGISMTSTNDIVITGNYRGTIGFDTVNLAAGGSPFDYDGYVAKIDGNGSVIWAESFGSATTDYSNGVAIDASDNIWLTGTTGISPTFGSINLTGGGNNNVFIAKFNSGGNATYAFQTITGTSNESSGIDIDNDGFVYITGNYFNPITFGPFTLNNGNFGSKYFIVKFNGNSNSFEWALGPDFNQAFSPSADGNGIVVTDAGELFVTGTFSGTLDFTNTTLVTSGSNDVFVTRIGECSNLSAQISAAGSTNICAGSSVLLEADTAAEYNYQWLFNGAPIAGQFNESYAATASGNYSLVVDSLGCIDTSNVLMLTVSPLPNVSHSNLNAVCQNESAFLLQGGSPLGGVYSGSAVISGSTFDPSLANLGTNLVTYTYTDGNSCSDSVTKTIVVNQTPAVFINSIAACENGASISLAGPGYGFPQGGIHMGPGVVGSTFNPSVAGPGTHVIYYATAAGCAADDSIIAVVTPAPTVSITPIPDQCISTLFVPLASYGSPFGGTFSGPGVSSNFFYPAIAGPGTHQVIYSFSASGCTGFDTFQLVVDPIPNVVMSVFPDLCEGSDAISLVNYASPQGGVFSGIGISNDTIFDPATSGVGNFTIQYDYSNVCGSDSATAPIAVYGNPTLSLAASDVSCNGLNDGSAAASAASGQTPYAFVWSNASSGSSINGLSAGNYSVTVSDANGCSDSSNFSIAQPPALLAALSSTNVTCNAGNDGSASVVASGGAPAYSYLWSDGQTASTASGLSVGSYSVTISDANGCIAVETAVITEPTLFSTTVVSADVDCFGGNDGSASVSASGGTPGYTYLWSNGNTSATVSGLSAGNYSVTTSDVNGCDAVDAVTISEPSSSLTVSFSAVSDVSCFGGTDGSVSASGLGGTAPYSFIWSNGSTNNSISGLPAGSYSLTLTDANGCQASQSITISEPASAVSASIVSSTNAICVGSNNGDATAAAVGGTPGYSYSWSNGASTSSINGLVIGTYELTVTDGNGCFDTTSVDIIPATTAAVASISSFSNATCLSSNDGSAQVSVVGGTAPYAYAWSNGANTATISGLSIGSYTVTVNSSNGCTDTISVSIINSDTIAPVVVMTNDTVALSAAGTALITLDSVRLQSTDNCGIQSEVLDITSFSCAEIGPNTVTLTVTDNSGNVTTETATVLVVDTTSPTILISNTTLYLDASGAADLDSSMIDQGTFDNCGIASYSLGQTNFDCSSAGQIVPVSITVVDVNGNVGIDVVNVTVLDTISPVVIVQNATAYLDASGIVNLNSASIDNGSSDDCGIASLTLDNSTFTCANVGINVVNLIATDANGNTNSAQALVTILDTIAPVIQSTDTSIYLDASGSFTIDTAFINVASSDNCGIDTMYLSRYTFDCSDIGVPQTVALYAVDVNGNIDSSTNSVSVFDTISPNVIANNVQLYLDVTGFASISPASVDGGSFDACGIDSLYLSQVDFQCNDTGSNVVTLFAIDVNGNIGQSDFIVNVFDTVAPVIIANNLTAYLDVAGNASASVDSANAGTFDNCGVDSLWLSQVNFDCSHIGLNNALFNALDSSGNQSSTQITITILDTIAPEVYPFELLGLGLDANGMASLSIAQADSATFDCDLDSLWLSQTDFTCNEIGLNSVFLYAVDSSGNIDSALFSVLIFDSLSQLEIVQDVEILCHGDSSAVISALATGMNGTYAYEWNTGDTTAQIENLSPGSYFVTVTSAAGCSISDSITISEPEPFATLLNASRDSMCAGDSSAFITAMVEGNNAPYSFLWSNGSTNDSLIGIGPGLYFVNISDINGCETFDSISIAFLDCDTVITPGIAESFSMNELSIFPNPASNVLNVNFGIWTVEEDVKMTLMNSTGQFVKTFDRDQWNQVNPNEVQLNLDEVATGIYLLNIQTKGIVATKRFVVGR